MLLVCKRSLISLHFFPKRHWSEKNVNIYNGLKLGVLVKKTTYDHEKKVEPPCGGRFLDHMLEYRRLMKRKQHK